MDETKLKKRIYAFQFAGVMNLFLGGYVLLYGGHVDPGTRNVMLFFFFGFAILDFWFPTHLKKKFAEQQALMAQAQQAAGGVQSAEPPKS
jgi:hypothetical protein